MTISDLYMKDVSVLIRTQEAANKLTKLMSKKKWHWVNGMSATQFTIPDSLLPARVGVGIMCIGKARLGLGINFKPATGIREIDDFIKLVDSQKEAKPQNTIPRATEILELQIDILKKKNSVLSNQVKLYEKKSQNDDKTIASLTKFLKVLSEKLDDKYLIGSIIEIKSEKEYNEVATILDFLGFTWDAGGGERYQDWSPYHQSLIKLHDGDTIHLFLSEGNWGWRELTPEEEKRVVDASTLIHFYEDKYKD